MRYLTEWIENDLKKKMVFLSGPRQCGKTTLAKQILQEQKSGLYLNWDDSDHRKRILHRDWSDDQWLIVLDEIHKYPKWKSWLKGLYDTTQEKHCYLITGSARLDIYRRGGDSMLGRYHPWALHPFCLAEKPESMDVATCFQRLLELGGFPEPFLSGDPILAKRWRRERRDLVLREDIRDLERIREITLLSLLVDQLATRVGGPVVVSNIAEDLQVAPKTVKHWIEILARMYLVFSVTPYTKSLPRAIQKPPKVYFYDNSEVTSDDPGARFENLIATHLLKRLDFLKDSQGDRYELNYVRDKEGHEVDFVILKERKPICLIEAKWSDPSPSSSLTYFGEKLDVQNRIQLVGNLKQPLQKKGVRVVNAAEWLSQPLDSILF